MIFKRANNLYVAYKDSLPYTFSFPITPLPPFFCIMKHYIYRINGGLVCVCLVVGNWVTPR